LPHAGVAVQAHDQDVTEFAGLFQAAKMSRMQQIEAAIGEHNAAAIAFPGAKPQNRFV
jgi:hypothetical protein